MIYIKAKQHSPKHKVY